MQRTKPRRRPNPNREFASTTVVVKTAGPKRVQDKNCFVAIAFTKHHDLRVERVVIVRFQSD
jgi:hypothetical protein